MEIDNIYKLIGGAVAFLFIIYIISKTIQSNTRIIEGLKMNDNNNDNNDNNDDNDDSSSNKKSSKSNKNSDDDKEWVSNTNDSIKTINKDTNDNSEKIKKHKDLYKKLFVAKRQNLNAAFLNVLFVACYKDEFNKDLSVLATLKQQIDLLDYAIGSGGNGGND